MQSMGRSYFEKKAIKQIKKILESKNTGREPLVRLAVWKPKSGKRAIRFTDKRQLSAKKRGSRYLIWPFRAPRNRTHQRRRRRNSQSKIESGRRGQPEGKNNRSEAAADGEQGSGGKCRRCRAGAGRTARLRTPPPSASPTSTPTSRLPSSSPPPAPFSGARLVRFSRFPNWPSARGVQLCARALDLWFLLHWD